MLHDHVAPVRENAQLGERLFYLREFLVEGHQGAAQPVGRDAAFDQLLCGPQADEVAEIVEFFFAALAWRNQPQLLPVGQLFVGNVQDALEFAACESFSGAHRKKSSSHFSRAARSQNHARTGEAAGESSHGFAGVEPKKAPPSKLGLHPSTMWVSPL